MQPVKSKEPGFFAESGTSIVGAASAVGADTRQGSSFGDVELLHLRLDPDQARDGFLCLKFGSHVFPFAKDLSTFLKISIATQQLRLRANSPALFRFVPQSTDGILRRKGADAAHFDLRRTF